MKVAKYSRRDSRGVLMIDCAECERGGNGSYENKCSCGGHIKKGGRSCCFAGTLLDGLEVEKMCHE